MDFRDTTVEALAGLVRAREVSARELTQAALDRIDAVNPTINAFVAVDPDLALADAARVDEEVAAGRDPGPLAGIPIGVKDLEDATGFVTTQGSLLRRDDAPAGADSALRGPAAGRRVRRGRQDQHPRAGREGADVQPALRDHPEPVGPGPHGGRLLGRFRGRAGRGAGPAGDGVGRRWLDPHPGVALRSDRHEAVARPGADRRRQPAGLGRPLDPRADGRAGPRHRVRARPGRRTRPDRPALPADAGRLVAGGARRPARAAAGRVGADPRLLAGRPRGALDLPDGGRRARRRRERGRGHAVGVPRRPDRALARADVGLEPAHRRRTCRAPRTGRCSTIRSARPPSGRRSGSPRPTCSPPRTPATS